MKGSEPILPFEVATANDVRDGAPLIVLLHGRGSDRHDLMGLRAHLPEDAVVVAPQAPFRAAPWGYGPGWAWYRYLEWNRPEPDSFERAQRSLHQFLQTLPDRLPVRPGALVLGGFSQGGTMSIGYALRNPGQVPLVLNFSGFVADHPSVRVKPETVRSARFFWGHGTFDPAIPFELAIEGRAALREAGADLEARDYPVGHTIDAAELRDAVDWISRGL